MFHRIVPGQSFKLDDGTQGPTGNLHMGTYNAANARPFPDPSPQEPTELWRNHFWTEFGGANSSFLDPWGNQLMLWQHLPDAEQDEETHQVVGDYTVPDGWTVE